MRRNASYETVAEKYRDIIANMAGLFRAVVPNLPDGPPGRERFEEMIEALQESGDANMVRRYVHACEEVTGGPTPPEAQRSLDEMDDDDLLLVGMLALAGASTDDKPDVAKRRPDDFEQPEIEAAPVFGCINPDEAEFIDINLNTDTEENHE